MGQDQAVAVEQVATSGRVCDVLVGPAGTGKTVALSGLLAAWEAEHGPGSVKGPRPLGLGRRQPGRGARRTDREHGQVAERAGPGGRAAGGSRPAACLAAQLPAAASQAVEQRAAELEAEARRWQLTPGDLLIVDEASLAGTFALDRLVAQARQAGAKILLVGDPAQLGAVGAGGAFGLLVADRHAHQN